MTCITHHHACDCREAKHAAELAGVRAQRDDLHNALSLMQIAFDGETDWYAEAVKLRKALEEITEGYAGMLRAHYEGMGKGYLADEAADNNIALRDARAAMKSRG